MVPKTLVILLAAGALASAQLTMTVWRHDGSKTAWTISETDRVPLDSQALTWQQQSIPLSQVRKITFSPATAVAAGKNDGSLSAPMSGESLDAPRRAGFLVEVVTLDGRVVKELEGGTVIHGKCNLGEKHALRGLGRGLYLLRYRLPGREHRLTPVLGEGKR